jgi:hypothetical protein
LKLVVKEYRALFAGKNMSLDREFDYQPFKAKKELEAELVAKVEAAVSEKAAELDSAQNK